MADLFTRLARRTLGLMPVVQPRIVSRFAREEAMASENANIEIPRVLAGARGSSLSPVQPSAAQLSPSDAALEYPEKQEGTPEGLSIREAEDRGREVQRGLRSGNQESERIAEVRVLSWCAIPLV